MYIHFLIVFLSLIFHSAALPQSDPGDPMFPRAIATICNGLPGIPRSIETMPGTNITRIEVECPPVFHPGEGWNGGPEFRREFQPRGGCNIPPNSCSDRFWQSNGILGYSRCGAQCDSECYWGNDGPDPNDCEVVFNWFRNGVESPIFTLERDRFLLYRYQTCGTGFQNQIQSPSWACNANIIYDFPDWAAIGSHLAWSCAAPAGARGGKCVASSNDFYTQVFRWY